MEFAPTLIRDVVLVEPTVFSDERGYFCETWHADRFRAAGIHAPFVQDNHSHSRQGVLRGLHYQITKPQGKLVRVLSGAVFDVAVDLRRASPTFGQWVGTRLSADNRRMLWIPERFAHGFYVLSQSADIAYKCTDLYAAEDERTIRWDDPDLAITWPLIDEKPPIVSPKDEAGAAFRDAEHFA